MINPSTGNCIKAPAAAGTKSCKAGYYLNPATNRCKKVATTTLAACKEGYERNPLTNRCRKIVTTTGQEYAVTPTEDVGQYHNRRIFVALAGVIIAVVAALAYIVIQFRHEIRDFFRKLRRKLRFRKV